MIRTNQQQDRGHRHCRCSAREGYCLCRDFRSPTATVRRPTTTYASQLDQIFTIHLCYLRNYTQSSHLPLYSGLLAEWARCVSRAVFGMSDSTVSEANLGACGCGWKAAQILRPSCTVVRALVPNICMTADLDSLKTNTLSTFLSNCWWLIILDSTQKSFSVIFDQVWV